MALPANVVLITHEKASSLEPSDLGILHRGAWSASENGQFCVPVLSHFSTWQSLFHQSRVLSKSACFLIFKLMLSLHVAPAPGSDQLLVQLVQVTQQTVLRRSLYGVSLSISVSLRHMDSEPPRRYV